MGVFTTEITSDLLPSDNPLHQRLLKPYIIASKMISGHLLELGCGEGRGVEELSGGVQSYTGIDKIGVVIDSLRSRFPGHSFHRMNFPPLKGIADSRFDAVIAFQVIEHIEDDRLFLQEIYRVLRPGGKALLSTPNRNFSLTRNPWHVREYLPGEFEALSRSVFDEVEIMGIAGNPKVMEYHQLNRKSVERITRWDFMQLQYRLPAWILRWPYELLNRMNRMRLRKSDQSLVAGITADDYYLSPDPEESLDLMGIFTRAQA